MVGNKVIGVPATHHMTDLAEVYSRKREHTQSICRILCFSAIFAGLLALLSLGSTLALIRHQRNVKDIGITCEIVSPPPGVCRDPPKRKEWRQLDGSEKRAYIDAVKCLHHKPSGLGLNGTLHDDFAYIHRNVEVLVRHFMNNLEATKALTCVVAHDRAPFLTWHRFFIHAYENKLRKICGYEGELTYWDWALDWQDPANSSIWDSETGFGGNGNSSSSMKSKLTVGYGYCVTDGPFAGLQVQYEDRISNPHCLSRGFKSDNGPGRFSGENFRPENMDELFRQDSFTDFMNMMEMIHNGIPSGVRGDFSVFSAPNGK